MSDEQDKLTEAKNSISRVQNFDCESLGRRDELGKEMNFEEAIPHAKKAVDLFRKIPTEILDELPDAQLNQIQNHADNVYKLFDGVLSFKLSEGNPNETRSNFINQIKKQYDGLFPNLYPWISYAAARTVDFNRLDSEARAAVQRVEDRASQMEDRFEQREKTLDDLEERARSNLAEQGVSRQARFFRGEAIRHYKQAQIWAARTRRWAALVATIAILSLFSHKIRWIEPENITESIQFLGAKVLLIGVLTFMLVRSARNYRAHRHNEVINRHKQNSLLTFNALVDAGSTPETRNIVLNHAASSIYLTPETGYAQSSSDHGASNTNLVELLPRATPQSSEGA